MKFSRLFLITFFLAAAILAGCSAAPDPAVDSPPANVESDRSIVAEGMLLPAQSLDLSFSISGRVAEVLAAQGSLVKAGEVIARLEVAAPEARQADLARAALEVEAARSEQAAAAAELLNARQALDNLLSGGETAASQLRFAIADLDVQIAATQESLEDARDLSDPDALAIARLEAQLTLYQAQKARAEADLSTYTVESVSAAALEAAQARQTAARQRNAAADSRLAAAEAGLLAAQAALRGTELTAPWDGVLAASSLKAGSWVTSGLTVASLADFSTWVVETDNLTEIDVIGIEPGQTVTMEFDALPGFVAAGTVESVASKFEEKRGDVTYTVRILVETIDPSLRWGMTAAVRFEK